MPKRSKDQIIANILSTCQGAGTSKTHIVYQTNPNFRSVNLYLERLIAKDLIEVVQGKFVLYKTTSKGERALECLREIEAIFY
jgi:predicted transcriptional regulator